MRPGNQRANFQWEIAPLFTATVRPATIPASSRFALSYQDVVKKGKTIGKATASHIMPPWKRTILLQDRDERRLTDEEITMIQSWVSQGMQEGTEAKPEPPKFASGWQLANRTSWSRCRPHITFRPRGRILSQHGHPSRTG